MTSLIHAGDLPVGPFNSGRAAAVVCAVLALALAGCGAKKDKVATQVAAKVNKEEISVHQINFVLQQQRGLRADQTDAASRQVLDRLIDQELAVQKAQELKLDRDPRVQQQLEAVRRDVIARAYVEKMGESVGKPSPEAIKQYYEDKPWLFKERRIYNIQEVALEAKPEQMDALRAELKSAKSINDFLEYLKANNIRFAVNQAVRAAEQLPLTMVESFSKLKDGQALLMPSPAGAQVVVLAGSRSEPIDEARAAPAIEQFLMNDAKRKIVEADMKAMRAAAKIEYIGKYAEAAASAPAGPASTVLADPVPASAAPLAVPPASAGEADAISKGLSGLK